MSTFSDLIFVMFSPLDTSDHSLHCDPALRIMELIPENENSSISYLIILSYGRDTMLLNKTKISQIGVLSPEL